MGELLVEHGTARADVISIVSQALGPMEVDRSLAISMVEPFAGFADCRHYVTIDHVREDGSLDATVTWLQALEEPYHAFVATDPWLLVPDYAPEIPDADAEQLRLRRPEDAAFLAILTIPRDREQSPTINLRAPVVVNVAARIGKQVVLLGDQYRIRHPLDRLARGEDGGAGD